MEKYGMEKDIIYMVNVNSKLKKEMEKEKNIIKMVKYNLKENI